MKEISVGELRHWLTLQNPGPLVSDNDGGYTQVPVDLDPAQVRAAIQPATAYDLEHVVSNVEQSKASHVVTIRYHPQVTTQTRALFGTRVLQVTGLQNIDERNRWLVLACMEVVA